MAIRSSLHHLSLCPSDRSVQSILSSIQRVIDKGTLWDQEKLIKTLNPMILGWVRYHQNLPTSTLDIRMNAAVRLMLRRWAEQRHPRQSSEWIESEYWHQNNHKEDLFSTGATVLASFTANRVKQKNQDGLKNPFLDESMAHDNRSHLADADKHSNFQPYPSSSPYPPAPWLNEKNRGM